MKKILCLIAVILIAAASFAQSTTPRFGTAKNQDNTGRVLTYAYVSNAYAATSTIKTNAYETHVKYATLTGAITLTANVTTASLGDRMILYFVADGTNRVVTFSTGFAANKSTLTVTASTKFTVTLIFDGVAWVETGR